jgi:hypothetical protein
VQVAVAEPDVEVLRPKALQEARVQVLVRFRGPNLMPRICLQPSTTRLAPMVQVQWGRQ